MLNRFPYNLIVLFVFNIFFLLTNLHAQSEISQDKTSTEYVLHQEKESLDVNKINSSVDAGSFYSVDASIRQLEENMAKMAQELNRLKQHVEFAKMAEQKRILQIQKLENEVQKLEKENVKTHQLWLNNSLDNSWTGSSSKIESMEFASAGNKSHDSGLTSTTAVKQSESAHTQTVTSTEPTQIAIATLPVPAQSDATQTVTDAPQAVMSQTVTSPPVTQHPVRQDIVVQVVEYEDN